MSNVNRLVLTLKRSVQIWFTWFSVLNILFICFYFYFLSNIFSLAPLTFKCSFIRPPLLLGVSIFWFFSHRQSVGRILQHFGLANLSRKHWSCLLSSSRLGEVGDALERPWMLQNAGEWRCYARQWGREKEIHRVKVTISFFSGLLQIGEPPVLSGFAVFWPVPCSCGLMNYPDQMNGRSGYGINILRMLFVSWKYVDIFMELEFIKM